MKLERDVILYDGDCGVCRRLISSWQLYLERRNFDIRQLQEPGVSEFFGLPEVELLRDVRCVTAAGQRIAGADVYRHIAKRIWWARPLAYFSKLPGLRCVVDAAYRKFADNRHRFSDTCRIKSDDRPNE